MHVLQRRLLLQVVVAVVAVLLDTAVFGTPAEHYEPFERGSGDPARDRSVLATEEEKADRFLNRKRRRYFNHLPCTCGFLYIIFRHNSYVFIYIIINV